ncbi:hypothetical protein PT974_05694 [Cladobotryum mycophilum]|uniref:Uncharacterized protein n=1 Tax=Cladobotryum mycophilum TaxID=491253 RepID=A0ABR0SJI6_9HYPO
MSFKTLGRIVTVSGVSAAVLGGAYAASVYSRISPVPKKNITTVYDVPDSFKNSRTVREFVNPRGYNCVGESLVLTLDIPAHRRDVSDEVLLAQFVKGFFGGRVFAPEAAFLTNVGIDKGEFTKLASISSRKRITKALDLSEDTLPPLFAAIFHLFHVTDVQLQNRHGGSPTETESSIDIAFGSDQRPFSGAHRFSILRDPSQKSDDDDGSIQVRVYCGSVICNPVVDTKDIAPWIMWKFHDFYSVLLFREAVAEMKRFLGQGPGLEDGMELR